MASNLYGERQLIETASVERVEIVHLNVDSANVAASAAIEGGIGVGVATAVSSTAVALTSVLPMGADLDSIAFAAALNAAGAAGLGAAGAHAAARGEFAGTQSVAATTYAATEALREIALSR